MVNNLEVQMKTKIMENGQLATDDIIMEKLLEVLVLITQILVQHLNLTLKF